MNNRNTAYTVAILFFNCKKKYVRKICEWAKRQCVTVEIVFLDSIDVSGFHQNIKVCSPNANESKRDHIFRAAKGVEANYVTWMDADDYFYDDALLDMCKNLENDKSAKAVCANFSFSDRYGDKVFSPYPHIGRNYVIQQIRTCFIIEKEFLLKALQECYADLLFEQFIWYQIYEEKSKINWISKVLMQVSHKKYIMEQEQNFKFLIRYFANEDKISDLKFLLKSIDEKNPQGYLYNRLMDIISPGIQKKLENMEDSPKSDERSELNFPAYIKRKIFIIYDHFGGLGDNLFYSHLPRIAKEFGGYDKVYYSKLSRPRSREIVDLVWKNNPFVDGMIDEKANFFVSNSKIKESILQGDGNLLDYIMIYFGMDDHKRFHEPEIYYTPNLMSKYAGKIIFDPNYITNAGDDITPYMLQEFFAGHAINIDFSMSLRSKYVTVHDMGDICETKTLFEFCDVLSSAREVFCFATGTASLCAALRKRANVLHGNCVNKIFLHSRLNNYILLQEKMEGEYGK